MDEKVNRHPSIFKTADRKSGIIEIYMTEEELLSLIDSVSFAFRMYHLTAKTYRESDQIPEADKMEVKAVNALTMVKKLIADGDPGYAGFDGEIM